MKKLLLCLFVGVIAFCCTACTNGEIGEETGLAETDYIYPNEEIKVGKYYLAGGDDTQYIEIKEGFGIEFVGFDFYQELYDLNEEYIKSLEESGDEEQLQLVLDDFRETDELRKSCVYYQITKLSGNIMPKPVLDMVSGGGWVLAHPDENTIEYTKEKVYVYREE